ncbi:MAG: hypothetical protein KDD50_01040, partial [Bdellovibrionales bacterium]|nr:hypothetical protein [Bdellovibrionales bacterium]
MNESELIQKKNKKSRWPLFLTGLALSLFVGGAIRTQLNSEKLVSQINQSIYQIHSKFQVKLGEVNVNLSKGLIPVFEIAIKDMNLLNSAGCSGIDELDIKDIRLNVGFFSSLWNKKLIIEGIQIGDLKIDRSQGLCVSEQGKENSQEVAAESLEGPNSSKNHEIPFSKEEVSKDAKVFKAAVQNFFRSDLHQLLLYIHSIEIQRLVLNNKTPEFEVKAIEIDILSNSSHNTSIKVTGELNYPQYKIYFSKASLLKVDISKDHISFQLDTQYKEGLIQTRGVFDLELSSYKMKSYLKNFPLWKISEIFGTLQTNLFTQLKTKNLWIDCSLEASWLVESNQSKAEVQKCFLHGPDGKIFISGAASDLMGKVRLDGVKLTIEQFSLKSLLNYFDSKGPSGILSQYGFLDGELSIDSLEKMSWKWSLSDVEMHFLNRGRRGFEKLNFISGQMNLADHRFSGLIEKIDFDKGEFKGEISFNVDETFRSGLAQFNVSRLIFSEGIQGLLFGGSSSTAEVYGQAKIEDGLVKKWRGSIGFSEIDGVNWNIEKLKLNVNYDDKLLDMRVKLKKLNFLK